MSQTAAQDDTYTLSGRAFVPVTERTFEHDIYTMMHARAAGLTDIGGLLDPERGIEGISWEILSRVYGSGHLWEVLAGVLVEQGQRWSREVAAENAHFFSQLTDAADKAQLQTAIVELVLGFFAIGVTSSGASLSSLLAPLAGAAATTTHPETVAAPISATGAP